MMGRICETGGFYVGSESVGELWMLRVVSQQRKRM